MKEGGFRRERLYNKRMEKKGPRERNRIAVIEPLHKTPENNEIVLHGKKE